MSFCQAEGVPILMRVPFEHAIAEGIAQGCSLTEIRPEYTHQFKQMMVQIAVLLAGTVKAEGVL